MNEILRQEKKFKVTREELSRIRYRLSQVLKQDSHNGAVGYKVRSLYFDTMDDSDYYDKENGLELRKKIRLRCYRTDDPFAMLEMKQKQGMYQKKRSLKVSREDAEALCQGKYQILRDNSDPFAQECYALMQTKCYRPKVIIDYDRIAFIAKENQIRITLDHDIRATESCFDIFSEHLLTAPAFNAANGILEVKYNQFLLSYIKDLLGICRHSEEAASKYCLGRLSLNQTF